jgi:hypothetical protein
MSINTPHTLRDAYKSPSLRHNNTMVNRTQVPESGGGSLESAITKLKGLSQESQAAVAAVIELYDITSNSSQTSLTLRISTLHMGIINCSSLGGKVFMQL